MRPELLEGLVDLVVVDRVQDGELLALAAVADGGHGEDLARRRRSPRCSASSTRPCGTISPPIFENRESRPVIFRNPSSSSEAEVAGDVPAVAERGRGQVVAAEVAPHHVRALDQDHALGVRGRAARRSRGRRPGPRRPASGWPTNPRREPGWKNPGPR